MNKAAAMTQFARDVLGLSRPEPVELTPLSDRGSDRSYYRLTWGDRQSAMLMHYNRNRRENSSFVDIARFLDTAGIPIPQILGHDPEDCFIVMQDLGSDDLWTMRGDCWERRRALYEKALEAVRKLHSYPPDLFPRDRISLAEAFGPALYRWEHDYFRENFVVKFCRIPASPSLDRHVEAELATITERLTQMPCSLVHRDLQSQNVMVCNGAPYFIDFQGMRFGTLFYDLGSLLYDPYVDFPESEREALLDFYFQKSDSELDWSAFQSFFLIASVQRLMQALGAYVFLGTTRGLTEYLKHIGPGLENLISTIGRTGTLPHLNELALRCRESCGRNGLQAPI